MQDPPFDRYRHRPIHPERIEPLINPPLAPAQGDARNTRAQNDMQFAPPHRNARACSSPRKRQLVPARGNAQLVPARGNVQLAPARGNVQLAPARGNAQLAPVRALRITGPQHRRQKLNSFNLLCRRDPKETSITPLKRESPMVQPTSNVVRRSLDAMDRMAECWNLAPRLASSRSRARRRSCGRDPRHLMAAQFQGQTRQSFRRVTSKGKAR